MIKRKFIYGQNRIVFSKICICGKGFETLHNKTKYCSRGCFHRIYKHSEETRNKTGHKGSNHWNWKGGKKFDKDGYIYFLQPLHPFCKVDGYILEHRLIVEKYIKRFLTPKETVHHINGIKSDNRPQNLIAFIFGSAHTKFHKNPHSVKPSDIIFDGSVK